MKRSKSIFVRFLLKFARDYLPKQVLSIILFIRSFRKFKKEINKDKSSVKFSDNLDEINQFEYKITSQNNEDGIIEHIFIFYSPNSYPNISMSFAYFSATI